MKSLCEFCLLAIWFPFEAHGQSFLLISITDISSDAESHEKQDGAKHFIVQPKMAKLWPNLCEDAGKKEEVYLSLPEDGCFYWRCLPMRPF